MSHQFRNPEPHLYFSTKGTSANAAKVQDQQMLPSPPYFTNSALTSKFNKNCIYYNLATFCFLPNFFYKPLQSSVNCILAPALASILGHPQRPSITKRNTFTGISLGAFPYAHQNLSFFQDLQKKFFPLSSSTFGSYFSKSF